MADGMIDLSGIGVTAARQPKEHLHTALSSVLHDIRQLRVDASVHAGESTGNLDVLERRIEDQLRELAGLPAVQPSLELASQDEDGNRYCQILTLLGMEEEGDPVAAVRELIAELQVPDDDETRYILGIPNFQAGPIAHRFRAGGADIPRKAEAEQAFVLRKMLNLYLQHGAKWRDEFVRELDLAGEAMVAMFQQGSSE
jgi:hypothetical protein